MDTAYTNKIVLVIGSNSDARRAAEALQGFDARTNSAREDNLLVYGTLLCGGKLVAYDTDDGIDQSTCDDLGLDRAEAIAQLAALSATCKRLQVAANEAVENV